MSKRKSWWDDPPDDRPRWRIWFRRSGYPTLVVPAETERFARRAALIMAPGQAIKRIERVQPKDF